MRYVLPKENIGLVAQAHKIITGKPAVFDAIVEVTDPRMLSLIAALGGKLITLITLEADVKINVTPHTFGNPIAETEEAAAETVVKASNDKPSKATKPCEICQKPVFGGRAKICDDPACKKEKARRYMQAYNQRKSVDDAGVEEAPAEAAPLAVHEQDPQGSVISTNPATDETAAVPSE